MKSEERHDFNMAQPLTKEIIMAAIQGFEGQRRQLDGQIAELRSMLEGGNTTTTQTSGNASGKRQFSPDALRRMREAQQRRWAKVRGEAAPTAPAAGKRKRKLSAAGRKAISEAAKRRWELKRAQETAPAKTAASGRKNPAGKAAAKLARGKSGKRRAAKTVPASAAQAAA
jgi:hypothetical protein